MLLVKTVPLFAVCIFPSVALNSEPGQQQPQEELDERAPLFVAIGSVCQKAAGGSESAGPSNVDHDEAETPFPIFVQERAVVYGRALGHVRVAPSCGSCTCCFQGSHGKGKRSSLTQQLKTTTREGVLSVVTEK